jgi:hypothetical protein
MAVIVFIIAVYWRPGQPGTQSPLQALLVALIIGVPAWFLFEYATFKVNDTTALTKGQKLAGAFWTAVIAVLSWLLGLSIR